MEKEDLSFVADALLALCQKEQKAPFYTSQAFDLKLQRSARKAQALPKQLSSRLGEDRLLEDECAEVVEIAQLTPKQTDVLSRRLEGWTFEEIGEQSGATKQAAQNIFIQALKKLARAFHVYPYKGLSDTYRYEVRRGCHGRTLGRIGG